MFFLYGRRDPRDLHVLTQSFPTRRASYLRSNDPKNAVGLAAVACGAIVLGFSTIDAMRSDPTEKAEKAEKPDERQLANYDPKSIIAPTLADAPNDPNAPVPMTEVPALDGSQAPRTAGASGRPQKSEGQVIAEAQRRAGILAYGGENGGGVGGRSEEHTSELQSLMRISYAVFCLKKKNKQEHKKRITLDEGKVNMHSTLCMY